MPAIVAAALGCIMAMAGAAGADIFPSQLSGRWGMYVSEPGARCSDASCHVSYDLARCGEGWCGIEVQDSTCGRIAFRLDVGAPKPFGVEFSGYYERAESTQPYVIRASLHAKGHGHSPDRQLLLSVFGSTDGDFQPFRRTYPLHMVLARRGDAVCQARPRVS